MRVFCIDTSFLINCWTKQYPPHIRTFTPIWEKFRCCVESGEALICRAVWKEVEVKDDSLGKWLTTFSSYIVNPTDEHTNAMRQLMAQCPNIAAEPGRNSADPWVITLAQIRNGIVVTDEQRANTRASKPPKMPTLCDQLGIQVMKPVEFIGEIMAESDQ